MLEENGRTVGGRFETVDAGAAGDPAGGPQAVDVEALVAWAIGQTGYLPWRGCAARELMFDHGFTAMLKGTSHVFAAGAPRLRRAIDGDAAAVIAAVMALEPRAAALVIANARGAMRPDWMPGVTPRLVAANGYRKKRNGKKAHRQAPAPKWVPCSPEAVRAAREAYGCWRGGLAHLVAMLDGTLNMWRINGFAAPAEPWREGL